MQPTPPPKLPPLPPKAAGFTTHVPSLPNTFPIPPDVPEYSTTSSNGSRAKLVFIVILIVCAIGAWRQWHGSSSAMGAWQPSWEKGVDQSQAEKKPQLVLFTADWCPACNHFEETVLSRNDVTTQLKEKFILTKVDLSDRAGPNSQIAQAFAIHTIPSLVIVAPDGSRSLPLIGSVSLEHLTQWTSNPKLSKPR